MTCFSCDIREQKDINISLIIGKKKFNNRVVKTFTAKLKKRISQLHKVFQKIDGKNHHCLALRFSLIYSSGECCKISHSYQIFFSNFAITFPITFNTLFTKSLFIFCETQTEWSVEVLRVKISTDALPSTDVTDALASMPPPATGLDRHS